MSSSLLYSSDPELTYFEAHENSFEKDGEVILEKDALLISASKFFTADKIIYDQKGEKVNLEGHVIGLIEDELIFAKKAEVDLKTKLFVLREGSVIGGDEKEVAALKERVLSLRPESDSSQENRQKLLQKLQSRRNQLYRDVLGRSLRPEEKTSRLDEYEALLKQESALLLQPKFEKNKRDAKRNEIWSQTESVDRLSIPKKLSTSYFKIEGNSLKKLTQRSYEALDSRLSFCECDEDDSPAWAFRSSRLFLKQGKYASLENSVLELKGFPVLYLPYLRLPLFSEKKIGLLTPTFGLTENSGFSYEQDFYIPLSEQSEMLVGYNYLGDRGFKMSSSFRTLFSDYSFFEVSAETLRDRKWIQEKRERSALIKLYQQGLEGARTGSRPADLAGAYKNLYSRAWWEKKGYKACLASEEAYEECLEEKIDQNLMPGGSPQRGKVEWAGQYRVGEHFSFLSDGVFLSDHRYRKDLEKGGSLGAFATSASTRVVRFSGFKNKIALRSELFSASITSKIFDPIEGEETYEGYQLPVILNFQSRYISLFKWRFPQIYFRVQYRLKKLSLFREQTQTSSEKRQASLRLGEALMGDANFAFSMPLAFRQFFSLEYSFELQGKHLINDYSLSVVGKESEEGMEDFLGVEPSYLMRVKTGLNLGLPIEGFFPFKEELSRENALGFKKIEYGLRHKMDWAIKFHYFSKPLIEGRYGTVFPGYKFSTKENSWVSSSTKKYPLHYTSEDKEFLEPKMLLTFETQHSFNYSKRILSRSYKQLADFVFPRGVSEERKQAERELFSQRDFTSSSNLQHPSTSFSETRRIFFFKSDISIDFEKLKEKTGELSYLSSSEKLFQPWTPLSSQARLYLGFVDFSMTSKYDFYLKAFSELAFSSNLQLPLDLKLSSGISLEKKPINPYSSDVENTENLLRYSFGVLLSFFKYSRLAYSFSIYKYEDRDDFSFSKKVSLYFQAPSQCWGTRFSWSLPADSSKPYGTYFFSLFMKLGENRMDFGNLAAYFDQD